ncbi:MAG: hypothetical protein V1933_03925 [Candidatus Omnitrophota bacterium]
MKEQSKQHDPLPPASEEQDVAALIKKVQQQLVFLEKKIDILINQSETRPVSEQRFSKPFRSFSRPYHRSDRGQGSSSGERSYYPRRNFEGRRVEESREFGYHKKTYDSPRESDPGQERHFKSRYGGEKKEFVKKNKPLYHKRGDRG